MGKKSALVTGGAGFVGSALVRHLVDQAYEVTVLDDLSFGSKNAIPKGFARVIKGDIRSPKAVRKALDRAYDLAFHLAALHFIPYCNSHPEETVSVNVYGTHVFLEELRKKPPGALFFASTAAVYGPTSRFHREADSPSPTDIYGQSKLLGETLARLFQAQTGVPVVIGRLFNVFGPRETNPHLIPHILDQLKKGRTRLELGNTQTYRDFIFSADAAAVMRALAEKVKGVRVCNISSGQEASAERIVRIIARLTSRPLTFRSKAPLVRAQDRKHLRASMTLLRKALPRHVPRSIEEGLKELLVEEKLLPPAKTR